MNLITQLAGDALATIHQLFGSSLPPSIRASLPSPFAPPPPPKPAVGGFTFIGRMSTFGGPNDKGVAFDEDLALYEQPGLKRAPKGLFLDKIPEGSTGTARRLNPAAFYLAIRFATTLHERSSVKHGLGVCLPVVTPREYLLANQVAVSANGKTVMAWVVDWGPNSSTNRVADLSPGLAHELGLATDEMVAVCLPGIHA